MGDDNLGWRLVGRRRAIGRWAIAAPTGLAVNLLLIGLLLKVERVAAPREPPTMQVELEPAPQELRAPPSRSTRATASAGERPMAARAPVTTSEAAVPAAIGGEGAGALSEGAAGPGPAAIDPAWQVDPKAVERWRLTEAGRFKRACSGLSSEHLTDEEKDRCWGGFADRFPKPADPDAPRPKPVFKPRGLPPPPPSWANDAARQARCNAYRDGRAAQPRLRDGLC